MRLKRKALNTEGVTPSEETRSHTNQRFFRMHQKAEDTALSLGLHRIGQSVEVEDSPAYRGMVRTVAHLVRVEEK